MKESIKTSPPETYVKILSGIDQVIDLNESRVIINSKRIKKKERIFTPNYVVSFANKS